MTGRCPLSPAQEAALDEARRAADPGVNVTQAVVELRGGVDEAAFSAALRDLHARHDILRTAFPEYEADQEVHEAVTPALTIEDWRDLPEQDDHLERYLRDDRRLGVDLEAPPLLRAALLHREDGWHDLVLTFPEPVLDGRSLRIVLDDLAALHAAARSGVPADLPPPRPFSAYVGWLRVRLPAGDEEFWRRLLAGAEPATPVAATSGGRGARVALSGDLSRGLADLAAREGIDAGTLIEAAWALVLAGATGRDDVVLGVVRPCRPPALAGAGSIVGPLASTLPARARVPARRPLLPWLHAWAAEGRAAAVHGHVAPARIQEWCGVVLDSAVAWEAPAAGDGWRLRDLRRQPALPLALQALGGPEIQLAISPEPAGGLLDVLATLLEGMVARPASLLGDLPLLGGAERRRLVVDWNATERDYPRDACVHELVAARAARTPGALAVAHGGERLSYRELDERAEALARRLRALGAGRGERVGLCLERSAELVTGQLAVLKAGAAFVPLDPDAPAERLAFVCGDSRLRLVLTRSALLDRLPAGGVPLLRLDDPAGPPAPAVDRGWPAPAARELAYVCYTSGSTGRPKGVEVEHRALTSRATWCPWPGGMRPTDRVSLIANPTFDPAEWEIWAGLVAGASLHVPDEATRTSPSRLVSWLCDERITISFLPTPLAELVLEVPWPADTALRVVLVAGDRLHHVRQEGLPFEVHNVYGPTEATIFATSDRVRTGAAGDALPPIGRPIADTQVYVLDAGLRPLPVGFPGELCIGGDGVARGYAGRHDLTAAAFVPDHLGGRAGARLYRTGDVVRHTPAGSLEFLGRLDGQVKVRGVRVELGEVEAALLRQPGVAAAVAAIRDGQPTGPRLVAYVVPEPAAVLTPGRVRQALAGVLPGPMVPSAVVVLDELPVTANGKVDRAALPAPDAGTAASPAPRTPLEALLAGIWGETLGLDAIGIDDDFFQHGGHSLLGMRMILRIAAATGVDVPLRDLFDTRTVAALAARIEAVQAGGAAR